MANPGKFSRERVVDRFSAPTHAIRAVRCCTRPAQLRFVAVVCLALGACSSGNRSAASHGALIAPRTTAPTTTSVGSSVTSSPPSTTSTTVPTTTLGALPAWPGCLPDGSQRSVRPSSFVFACADGNARVEQARWTSWGADEALASGTVSQNDCVPSCAQGHFHAETADLTLYAPGLWHDHLVFTRLRVHLHAPIPGGTSRPTWSTSSRRHRPHHSRKPAFYHGGPVIHDPVVDIIVWGTAYPPNVLSAVQHTLQALAGSRYFNTLSQYSDGAGPIHNDLRLHGTWTDPTPPHGNVAGQITDEIAHARAVNGWNTDTNTVFLLLLPPGVSAGPCGWHGSDSPGSASATVFAVVPSADAPGCNSRSDPAYQLSFATYVTVHELAEAITDPFATAWYDFPHTDNSSVINEIADVCLPAAGVTLVLNDGTPAWVPELYSAATRTCQASG